MNAFNTTEQFCPLKKKSVLSQFKSSSSITESLSAMNGFAVSTVVSFQARQTINIYYVAL